VDTQKNSKSKVQGTAILLPC